MIAEELKILNKQDEDGAGDDTTPTEPEADTEISDPGIGDGLEEEEVIEEEPLPLESDDADIV